MSSKVRDKNGQFQNSGEPLKDAEKRSEEAKKEHGYSNLRSVGDYLAELNEVMEKSGLKKPNEETDELGFTQDFYKYIGIGAPRDFKWTPRASVRKFVEDMRGDTQSFYSPLDNMYGTASGQDTWYDHGRIPVSHLMALASKRIGVAYRACSGPAHDIFDNDFDFVKLSDPDTPLKTDKIEKIRGWMQRIDFLKKLVEIVDFDHRAGISYLAVEKYLKEKQLSTKWIKRAPKSVAEKLKTFSAFYMTPFNVYQPNVMDYNKQLWDFNGGLHGSTIHHSRVYVLEMRREELGLRGLSLPELCWVANMCYLNMQYYILKSMAQLGNVTIGVTVDRAFPTPTEVSNYLTLLNTMKANNFFVMGAGAKLQVENAAGKLGSGINDFMEFLKEDQSSAWIFPKNQLFGRSEGGGLDGAGALVSKEDYLASNISAKMLSLRGDVMHILKGLCHITGLDDTTIRFNIDLHKTEGQRLDEEMQREQVDQQKVMTEQAKIGRTLFKKQVKLQEEMVDIQMKMAKEDPDLLMGMSGRDEENLGDENVKGKKEGDFTSEMRYLKLRHDILENQFVENGKLLKWINQDTAHLQKIHGDNIFAWGKMRKRV